MESSVVPLMFLSFKTTGRKNDVLLNWAMELEVNNAGFFVERALAATSETWVELGFVAAISPYQFVDVPLQPLTDYLYRLRQTDNDGRVSYSDIRSARIGGGITTLQVYPNPTSGAFSYRWLPDTTRQEAIAFQLTDAHGRMVCTGSLQPSTAWKVHRP